MTTQQETAQSLSPVLFGGPLTYLQFRKLFPATRIWHSYSSEIRANHAASFRLGHRQRYASGEYYYTHVLIPDRAYDTAKQATDRAYEIYMAQFSGETK